MAHTLAIDHDLLVALLAKCSGRIKYRLGAKAPSLDCSSSEIHRIDCSGFVRYILHRVAKVTTPDGSANIWIWCNQQKFKRVPYSDCSKLDGALRIAFMGGARRHVWLVKNGKTIESCSGKGVTRMDWSVYAKRAQGCYKLTEAQH